MASDLERKIERANKRAKETSKSASEQEEKIGGSQRMTRVRPGERRTGKGPNPSERNAISSQMLVAGAGVAGANSNDSWER